MVTLHRCNRAANVASLRGSEKRCHRPSLGTVEHNFASIQHSGYLIPTVLRTGHYAAEAVGRMNHTAIVKESTDDGD